MGYRVQSSRSVQGSNVHLCSLCTAQLQGVPFYMNTMALHLQDLETRQDLEQMVSDEGQRRLMNGVQEKKKKSVGTAAVEPTDGERASKYADLA